MELEAQKRDKNNIVHLYDGRKQYSHWQSERVPLSRCGQCMGDPERDFIEVGLPGAVLEDYLIIDGDIIGKYCSNCQSGIEARVRDNE